MTLPLVLVDSSFLYALLDRANLKHALARASIEQFNARYHVPDVVLTEACFLFRRAGGVPAVLKFLVGIR